MVILKQIYPAVVVPISEDDEESVIFYQLGAALGCLVAGV